MSDLVKSQRAEEFAVTVFVKGPNIEARSIIGGPGHPFTTTGMLGAWRRSGSGPPFSLPPVDELDTLRGHRHD
jgi:hypothetical protein